MDIGTLGSMGARITSGPGAAARGGGIPPIVGVVAGVTAVATVGIMAYVGYRLVEAATRGVKLEATVDNLMHQYDHSRNGVIELDPGLARQEFIRIEEEDDSDDDMFTDEWLVYDGSAKLVAADADQDLQVTRPELRAFLERWDANGNGRLNIREGIAIERAHPDVLVDRSWSRPDLEYPYVPSTWPGTASGDS